MKDEVKALQDNETWNLVRPRTDRDVIPGKWVYKVKLGPSGQVDKYKARYVAKGFKLSFAIWRYVAKERKQLHETPEGNSDKTNTRK